MFKSSRSSLTILLCVLVLLLLAGGCGKRSGADEPAATPITLTPIPMDTVMATQAPTPSPEPTESPEPTPTFLSILFNGSAVNSVTIQEDSDITLTADTNSTEVPTFSSDNTAVADCDASGHVTALSAGTANITATAGDVTAVCKITVTEAPAPQVTICFWATPLTDFTLNASASETIQLTALVSPEEVSDQVVWAVEDPKIAEISEDGLVTALSEGTTKVLCRCGKGEASCILRVRGVRPTFTPVAENKDGDTPSLIITYAGYVCTDFTLSVGDGLDLGYKLYNAQNAGTEWSVKDTRVATVDQNGYVTAVGVGTTTLTCSCGGMTAECIVRVK